MDYFKTQFMKECKEKYSRYGFKRNNNVFIQVVNDVMQNFVIHRSVSGRSVTIEFGIIPLCYPIEKIYLTGLARYNLGMFESIKKWWDYDRNSQLDMNHCINEVTSYIDRYLIPFFERGNDCNKAYNEVCNFEFSYQPYKKTILMDDYNKYCMVLKVGKYDLAISHL